MFSSLERLTMWCKSKCKQKLRCLFFIFHFNYLVMQINECKEYFLRIKNYFIFYVMEIKGQRWQQKTKTQTKPKQQQKVQGDDFQKLFPLTLTTRRLSLSQEFDSRGLNKYQD